MHGRRPDSLLLTGDSMKRNTLMTALGGMCIALSAAIMMCSSIIPFLTYAIPAVAGLLILFMQAECGWKWALAVYVGTSIVCALVVPEKEAVGIYIAVLGYYPLLKIVLDKPKKVISIILKSIFFVVVIVAAYIIMMKVFGISTELLEETGKIIIPVLIVSGLAAFLLYDRALTLFEIAYYRKWQRKFRKIFRK